jgi:hypothetical protein
MVEQIRQHWGWIGLDPVEVIEENDFGNLLVKDVHNKYWRICPEDGYCCIVAHDLERLSNLARDPGFLRDWQMQSLKKEAHSRLGPLDPGQKYCLKTPGHLGGQYGGDNLGVMSLSDLICRSGELARSAHHESEIMALAPKPEMELALL